MLHKTSGRGRGRGYGRGSHSNNWRRDSGRTLGRSQNNSSDNNTEPDEIEFTPHHTGKNQGTTCDTMKKQITHDIRGKCKFGNDLAESLESGTRHKNKEDSWNHLGMDAATMAKQDSPMQVELIDHTEFVKERNERFTVHQDNGKKAHSSMCGHCNEAMQTHLENDGDFKNETKGDPFKMSEKIELKMCDPSKVKCPHMTSFEQLD